MPGTNWASCLAPIGRHQLGGTNWAPIGRRPDFCRASPGWKDPDAYLAQNLAVAEEAHVEEETGLRSDTGKSGGNLNLKQTVGLGNYSRWNVANGHRRNQGKAFAGDRCVGSSSRVVFRLGRIHDRVDPGERIRQLGNTVGAGQLVR